MIRETGPGYKGDLASVFKDSGVVGGTLSSLGSAVVASGLGMLSFYLGPIRPV